MKKEYMVPQMEVVEIKVKPQLLAGSDYGGKFNAPGFEWAEKGYEFGGWDLETE